MLVHHIMNPEVVTVPPNATLSLCYKTMQERKIRHLVVVSDGRAIGIVTDRDLRLATSALAARPFDQRAYVGEVMTAPPITASPRDPVEDAAQVMRSNRIGCLPVVDGDALVGIITNTDLLDAVIRLTGLHRPGGRLAVRLPDAPGSLGDLMTRLGNREVNVHSVLTYQTPEDTDDTLIVILRIGTLNTHAIGRSLREDGFDVRWPQEKESWSR